jgi:hypothetical protein
MKIGGRNLAQNRENYSKSISDSVNAGIDSLERTHKSSSNLSDAETFKPNSKLRKESEIGILDIKSQLTMSVNDNAENFTYQDSVSNIPKTKPDFHNKSQEEYFPTKKKKFVKKKATKEDTQGGITKIKKSNLEIIEEEKDKLSDDSSESHDIYDKPISKLNDLYEFSPFIVNPFKGEKLKKFNYLDTQSNFEDYTGYDEEGALLKDKLDRISKFRQEITDLTKGYMINLRIVDYLDLVDKFTKAIKWIADRAVLNYV